MLKSVAFKNFGYFSDFQRLKLTEGANFIIGSNAVGKGLILDLIRRCVSTKKYLSHYKIHSEENPAFIISEYHVDHNTDIRNVLSLCKDINQKGCEDFDISACTFIKKATHDRIEWIVYKLCQVHIGEVSYNFLNIWEYKIQEEEWDPINIKCGHLTDGRIPVFKDFQAPETSQIEDLLVLLDNWEHTPGRHEPSICLTIFEKLSDVSVSVFAKRSIGPIQWDKSGYDRPWGNDEDNGGPERTREERRKKKHADANDRAEILQSLLPSEDTEELKKANYIFKTLICPFEYTFEKIDRRSTVDGEKKYDIFLRNGKKSKPTRIELLRVPEGIIEAMHFALILVQKKFQTICLKEPDKGMHPQMIEKMRDLVLRSEDVEGKVMLIVSHNPAMIHRWSIDRTFICRQKRSHSGNLVHSVSSVKSDENMRARLIHEEMKNTMFAASVLFVEGIHDKTVMTMVFDQIFQPTFCLETYKAVKEYYKCENLTEKLQRLRNLVSGLVVVYMDGQTCRKNVTDMADKIDLPHIVLLDIDVAYSCWRLTERWKYTKTLLEDFGSENYNEKEHIEKVKQEIQKNVKKSKDECQREMETELEKGGFKANEIAKVIQICRPYLVKKGGHVNETFMKKIGMINTEGPCSEKEVASTVKTLLNPEMDKYERKKIKDMLGIKEWRETETDIPYADIKNDLSKARIHCWKNGNLEEVICNAVLMNNSTEELEDLKEFFNLKKEESKLFGKKFLSHIDERTLLKLVTKYLLKCEEMGDFLLFLLKLADKDFPLLYPRDRESYV